MAATALGRDLGLLSDAAAALAAAGLVSVLVFPVLALGLLRRDAADPGPGERPRPE